MEQELSVKPAERTDELMEQIQAGYSLDTQPTVGPTRPRTNRTEPPLSDILTRFQQLRETLNVAQRQLEQDIEAISRSLDRRQ